MISRWAVAGVLFLIAVALCLLTLLIELPPEAPHTPKHRCKHGYDDSERCPVCDWDGGTAA